MADTKPPTDKSKPSFTITSGEKDGVTIFSFSGYCTADAGIHLSGMVEELMQTPRKGIVWDFSACRLINSPGVVALMDVAMRIVDDFKAALVITGADATQISVFRMAGVIPVADLANDLDEAVKMAARS